MKKTFFIYWLFLTSFISGSEGFILFTSLYEEKNISRQQEFIECLETNLNNPFIKKVVIFFEKKGDKNTFEEKIQEKVYSSNKLSLLYINSRPTYEYYFRFANTSFPHEKIIISNGDIFFDNTLSLIDEEALINSLICLTRYDCFGVEQFDLHDKNLIFSPCQDTWIFKSPIKEFFSAIELGVLGCDPSIAYYAYKAGLKVYNPCKSIMTYHLHQSNIRTYNQSNTYQSIHPFLAVKISDLEHCRKIARKRLVRKI